MKRICLPSFAIAALTVSSPAALVAYFPLTDGTNGSIATTADDTIDDATHGITNATVNNPGTSTDTWVFDATRNRIVLSTTEGRRWSGGTQDINLNDGFTWSLWVNIAVSNSTDLGGDSIIGTRSTSGGAWNKIDLTQSSNWNGGMTYSTLADATWHHIAYVGDTTGLKLYKDGVEIGSDATVPLLTFNGNFEFGGAAQFSEDITGLYSDIAIYDQRLTESQIVALAGGADPTTIIPEPSAALLGALGFLALLRRRR